MNINELAREIHRNAVAHGWWEDQRKAPEIVALIRSEWSEALEEARDGRGNFYEGEHGKPEGVAVEMMDGCIRILDYYGKLVTDAEDYAALSEERFESIYEGDSCEAFIEMIPDDAAEAVELLHRLTSMFSIEWRNGKGDCLNQLFMALQTAVGWVYKQGLNPLDVLLKKHAYNKERPYKHGKRF